MAVDVNRFVRVESCHNGRPFGNDIAACKVLGDVIRSRLGVEVHFCGFERASRKSSPLRWHQCMASARRSTRSVPVVVVGVCGDRFSRNESAHVSWLVRVMVIPFKERGGAEAPPRLGELLLFLRSHAEGDAAVERGDFELDVEAFAVLMRPG